MNLPDDPAELRGSGQGCPMSHSAVSAHPTRVSTETPARPAFLITIDTEGDNLWAAPREITTENARFLPRFQQLCEKYRLKPTWLTNWEMVESPVYRAFGHDVLDRGTGEIGMHLHAWNSPPLVPLTADDFACTPFLTQYPESVMRQKIRVLTDRLEQAFGVRMLSHRAGRWAFNETYARLLIEHGYRIDCSVSPHTLWPHGSLPDEIDFRGFPEHEYFVDPDCISRPATSSLLLELPMTILPRRQGPLARAAKSLLQTHPFGRRVAGRLWPETRWLRPDGRNGHELVETMELALADGRGYVEFMLHSSEFMPGGSPRFPTAAHIERLYDDLERFFEAAAGRCEGLTLSEYHDRVVARARQREMPSAA